MKRERFNRLGRNAFGRTQGREELERAKPNEHDREAVSHEVEGVIREPIRDRSISSVKPFEM